MNQRQLAAIAMKRQGTYSYAVKARRVKPPSGDISPEPAAVRALKQDRADEITARDNYSKHAAMPGMGKGAKVKLLHIAKEEDHHKDELDDLLGGKWAYSVSPDALAALKADESGKKQFTVGSRKYINLGPYMWEREALPRIGRTDYYEQTGKPLAESIRRIARA